MLCAPELLVSKRGGNERTERNISSLAYLPTYLEYMFNALKMT